jgi:hypothetical protein
VCVLFFVYKKANIYLSFLTLVATIVTSSQAVASQNNSMIGFKLGLSGGYTNSSSGGLNYKDT